MTRILYWNIENFAVSKIRSSNKRRRGQFGPIYEPAHYATDRRNLILKHFASYTPDIVVVVEVATGAGAGPGHLITNTGGWDGAETLLTEVINSTGDNSWNLVPPLITGTGGRAEGVAVYYRSQIAAGGNRYFTGPYWWDAAGGSSVAPGAVAAAGNYPPYVDNVAWAAARAVPGGAQYNGGQQEDRMAARVNFGGFGGGLRTPYMTTFTETNAGGGVVRNITIFAAHAPPQHPGATQFVTDLANTAEVNAPLGANETRVIVGDFNLNLLQANVANAGRYAQLTAAGGGGYGSLFNPPNPAPGGLNPPPPAPAPEPVQAYKGYFATHMKVKRRVVFWTNMGQRNFAYPGYSYIGSRESDNLYSIDNILVLGGPGGAMTVANSVVGSPLNVVMPPPGGAPPGAVAMAHDFLAPPMGWPIAATAPFAAGDRQRYRGWRNFGHIRSTSDHLALFATV